MQNCFRLIQRHGFHIIANMLLHFSFFCILSLLTSWVLLKWDKLHGEQLITIIMFTCLAELWEDKILGKS